MCSTTDEWLGRICRAIDELATRSASGGGPVRGEPATDTTGEPAADATSRPGADAGAGAASSAPPADDTAVRLAAIWDMVADADPELAKRLPGYLSAAE
jgi:hypothetical protein